MEPMRAGQFSLGLDTFDPRRLPDSLFEQLGVQFLSCHLTPKGTLAEEIAAAREICAKCERNGVHFLYNTESANWGASVVDADGHDWANQPDGCHWFRFRPEVLAAYAESPAFAGMVFDEAEHMQINRNYAHGADGKKLDIPFFSETNGMSFAEANASFIAYAERVAAEYRRGGAATLATEHVWPTLFHAFARAGFTPCHKQMKESFSNLWLAMAMGAARQYGRELWTCIDLWYLNIFPGHSPEELEANLQFAYLTGCDKVFVENLNYNDTFYLEEQDGIRLLPNGEVFGAFAKEWLPAHPRAWTHRDYRPETAIIRFDDTDCGQDYRDDWRPMLYGAYNLQPTSETHEWFDAWHTITHGVTPRKSISWNYRAVRDAMPHRSFAPANGPIVYDENVAAEHLETLRLAFLCGLRIPAETLASVRRMVRENGLTAVTSVRFAPAEYAAQYHGGVRAFDDGAGRWVLTDDFAADELRALLSPLLGRSDEMTYRFGDQTLRLRITNGGDGIEEL